MIAGFAAGALSFLAFKKGGATLDARAIMTAMGIGASVKAGLKTADRATNNVKADALNTKLIIKDGFDLIKPALFYLLLNHIQLVVVYSNRKFIFIP